MDLAEMVCGCSNISAKYDIKEFVSEQIVS